MKGGDVPEDNIIVTETGFDVIGRFSFEERLLKH